MLDAWKWTEGVTFSVKVKANDGRSVRYDGERYMAKYSFGYDVPQKNHNYWLFCQGCNPAR